MEQDFPISSFLEMKKHFSAERKNLEKEKANWKAIRNSLSEAETNQLDEEFKTAFENLESSLSAADLQLQEQLLSELVKQKGASAKLLGNNELGTYNLAMFINKLVSFNEKDKLEIATSIIRTTIIADADLNSQKAYVGNGGMIAIEWVCMYLARGIGDSLYKVTIDQYHYFYRIFLWVAGYTELTEDMHGFSHPFYTFMLNLKKFPETQDIQEKSILQMIGFGWNLFTITDEYLTSSFFSRIADSDPKLLTMIIPFEHEQLKSYLSVIQKNISTAVAKNLLNSFSSSNKARKQFRTFFSLRPHWLLKLIITNAPETVFNLAKRNEQDLLAPFLKYYKREIAELKNENNQNLLEYAMTSRGVVENTIQLLRQYSLK